MPSHNLALPVSASNISIKDADGEEYDITLGTDTFNRAGEDGNVPIIPLNGGDEYVGEVCPGNFHKNWDANISTFTATINGGTLRMTGVAAVAGTAGNGWINDHHPVPMLDELELTVSMEVPVDDTGATANRGIFNYFYIRQDKDELNPFLDNNLFWFDIGVDENGLQLRIRKKVNNVTTILATGKDYNMAADRGTGNLEACIWRLVFNGKPGTVGATLSVYLKQAATLALAESATENEITSSPFDISDLAFDVGYLALGLLTLNTTYFGTTYDSANRAASTYLRVNYPSSFNVKYDFTEASYGLGEVELHDGLPSTNTRVYDEDHSFASDAYIQNSLIRLWVDELVQYGFKPFAYYGAAWDTPVNQVYPYLVTSAQALAYPSLRSVSYVSPEEVILKVRFLDSAVDNADYYIDADVTLTRGSRALKIVPTAVYPNQDFTFLAQNSTTYRFGYIGNNGVGDDDLNISATNATLTDNFLVAFDDLGDAALLIIYTDEKPAGGNARFETNDGGDLEIDAVDQTENTTTVIWLAVSPFSNNSDLFEEAEGATISGAARLHLVGAGEDTRTEGNSASWVATNCVITDDAVNFQVGTQSIKITSSGAGAVEARISVDALYIQKFDTSKVYTKTVGVGGSRYMNIYESGGGYVRVSNFGATVDWLQRVHTLPHSATDLGDYANAAYTFTNKMSYITFTWVATGAGEVLMIDGLHFYIDTTTARGRGETLSGSSASVLDAQNEYVEYVPVAGTDLPDGDYYLAIRVKDTDNIASDLGIDILNSTDTAYRDERGAQRAETLTSAFAYKGAFWFITNTDVTGTDNIRIRATKLTATENTLFVDYFLLIPIGDGESLPQDLAHSALRDITQHPRICER